MTVARAINTAPEWPYLRQAGAGLYHIVPDFDRAAQRCGGRQVYLASPYPVEAVGRDLARDAATLAQMELDAGRWLSWLAGRGVTAVSPLILFAMIQRGDFTGRLDALNREFWMGWSQPLLSASGAVVIHNTPGWDRSASVWRAACWAISRGCTVIEVEPAGCAA